MATYYVNLPSSGVSAEVEAPTTRSARTTYLDYLTRNKIVPWQGRNSLREEIITDRIESGQMDVDIRLNYEMEGPRQQEEIIDIGSQQLEQAQKLPPIPPTIKIQQPIPTMRPPTIAPTQVPLQVSPINTARSFPTNTVTTPTPEVVKPELKDVGQFTSKIARLSRRNLGRGRI